MQDQAFLGLEAALAIPDDDGRGVELHIATQWLHEDRKQIAACLGLPEERVRLVLGGVGGAFGAREDISLQVHTCLLALRLGRPVRVAYTRAESFLGHVHRHPAKIWMRHHATAAGEIVKLEARFVLDGGAYASTSSAVLVNAVTLCQGPYRCPNAVVEGLGRAHQPPAVRGDARVRRGPGVLRPRGADGQARRGVRARPRRDPPAQRDGHRRPPDHRPGRGERGARRPVHPRNGGTADARRPARRRADGPSRRRRSHRRCRARAARRRLGCRDQEPDVLRGLRRLRHGALPARRRRGDAEVRHRRGRSGLRHDRPADRPHRARRRRRRARADRHADRVVGVDVGVTSDVDERRCRRRRLPCRARAAVRARRRPPRHRSAAAGDRRRRRRRLAR